MPRSKIPTMTELPYTVREYYNDLAERQDTSVSKVIREILTAYFKFTKVYEKMEKSDIDKKMEEIKDESQSK